VCEAETGAAGTRIESDSRTSRSWGMTRGPHVSAALARDGWSGPTQASGLRPVGPRQKQSERAKRRRSGCGSKTLACWAAREAGPEERKGGEGKR
jgi:hypothetical protein